MTVSVRSYLTAGVAATVVGAMAIAPMQPLTGRSISLDTTRLSAAVQQLANPVNTAAALLGVADPLAASSPSSAQNAITAATPSAAATANNAASDWVIAAWNWADYWISYGADLTQYVLGWVWPLSLIGDQAPILWNNLGSPIGDATVYGLIAPVLNDPLNPAVWSTGLTIIAQTTVAALVNTAVAEFNYFVGWLLPPLPPLPFPPLPFAAAASPAAASRAAAAAEQPAISSVGSGTAHSARPHVAKQTPDSTDAAVITDVVTETTTQSASKTAAAIKTTKADSTDAASDNSGSTKAGGNTGPKKSTAGSARSHGPKGAKGGGA